MFESIPTEMFTGLVAGGLGAIIKLMAQSQANFMEIAVQGIKQQQANDDSADKAAQREGSPWARHTVALFVILVAFGGLVLAAMSDTPVTVFYETEVKEHLFGLFRTGGKMKTMSATGFALPPYVSHSVSAIVFFLFGAGAAKMARR